MSIAVKVVSAEWCSQCKPYKRQLEEQGIEFTSLDADDEVNQELLQRLGVRSLPTTLIFKDAEVCNTVVGNKVQELKSLLESYR